MDIFGGIAEKNSSIKKQYKYLLFFDAVDIYAIKIYPLFQQVWILDLHMLIVRCHTIRI